VSTWPEHLAVLESVGMIRGSELSSMTRDGRRKPSTSSRARGRKIGLRTMFAAMLLRERRRADVELPIPTIHAGEILVEVLGADLRVRCDGMVRKPRRRLSWATRSPPGV